ncbi:Z1 domain-containing protein [Gemmatimonadales bacterium]|nr:Z1 domain-containing protein [Gemmatimonadales bacterium]
MKQHANFKIARHSEDNQEPLTLDHIRKYVRETADFLGITDVDLERVCIELEEVHVTRIGEHRVLENQDDWEAWLNNKKAAITWRHWEAYESWLKNHQNWNENTVKELARSTDTTLGLLNDPEREGAWNRRGMVVGDVQSGKTAHYTGLINKAADAGYKGIIVLAGFHKSLRSQTQIRLEEGFLGYDRYHGEQTEDSASLQRVGVGHIEPGDRPDSITTRADDGDFKRHLTHLTIQPGGRPLLGVVKKNAHILRNLIQWFKAFAHEGGEYPVVENFPLLVIDDEADQGSVDTGLQEFDEDGNPDLEHDPKTINKLIRELLKLFNRHAYVGYTATPFANVFIHEGAETREQGEDLFPKSFILNLASPGNHIGPTKIFGYEDDYGNVHRGLPVIRSVDDHVSWSDDGDEPTGWMPPRHRKDHQPLVNGSARMPESLNKAFRSFILSTAARYARGYQSAHNSMLVHVTRFTAVQELVAQQIRDEHDDMKSKLRHRRGSFVKELRELWESDFLPTTQEISERGLDALALPQTWDRIEPHLEDVIASIKIREINGYAGEVLDYKDHEKGGLNVVAVGGDKLSRGLTLEGLTVSYFLRASRMYDTLMQMGRWFGYRPGYTDLCRLFTTAEMQEWFQHIAMASDELREDFDRMVASHSTPKEFGHRVRSHPVMMVTSSVKQRHGSQITISFGGTILETINFRLDRPTVEGNLAATVTLLKAAQRNGVFEVPRRNSLTKVWEGLSADTIVEFLRSYEEHEAARKVKTKLLAEYIQAENSKGRLSEWTVVLGNGQGRLESIGPVEIQLARRRWHTTETMGLDRLRAEKHYRIRRLLNPPDETLDLSEDEREEALRKSVEAWNDDPSSRKKPGENREKPTSPDGHWARSVRPDTRGVLVLYAINPEDDEEVESSEEDNPIPIIGFGISFPTVGRGETASEVKYTVSNVYAANEGLT